MKLEVIKEDVEFVKSFLPKKDLFDTRYNFNYVKIEPDDDNILICATDGFRMSTVEMPNILEITEPIFIHKDKPITEASIEKSIPHPNTKSLFHSHLIAKIRAYFTLNYKIIELLKELKLNSRNYHKNPILTFSFNEDGVYLTELKMDNFKFTSDIYVLQEKDLEVYQKNLIEPFTFSINAMFLEQHLEKYFKKWNGNFECRITGLMLIIYATEHKKRIADFVMGIKQ